MAEKRKAPLKRIIIPGLIAVLAITAIVLFSPLLGGPYFQIPNMDLFFGLNATRQNSGHDALLAEMRTLSELQSLEYIYKLVFPQDFFGANITLESIFEKVRNARSGDNLDTLLSTAEQLYLDAYNLSRDAGMQPLSGRHDFLVATAVISLGYDFDREPFLDRIQFSEPPSGENEDAVSTAIIRLPPAQILNIRIEDPDSSNYPYPDLHLDQENWRRIARFISSYVRTLPELESLQEDARDSLVQFFSTFLNEGVNIPVEFVSIKQ